MFGQTRFYGLLSPFKTVLLCIAHLNELAATLNQGLQLVLRFGRKRTQLWADPLSEKSKHVCVERVGLLETPDRLGKLARLNRIDDYDGKIRCSKCGDNWSLQTATSLQNYSGWGDPFQFLGKPVPTLGSVLDLK